MDANVRLDGLCLLVSVLDELECHPVDCEIGFDG